MNGLRDSTIYTFKGQIIDGKTRYKIASELKILGQLKYTKLTSESEALSVIISRNYLRRNLTKSQLAIIGVKLLSRLEKYQRTNEGRKRDSIAKQVGVSSAGMETSVRDGWHSCSTGSGTCSGHGGVSCWDCLTSDAEDTTQVIDTK